MTAAQGRLTINADDDQLSKMMFFVEMTFERITTDPDVMGGVPCIRGFRIPVATVIAMLADGMSTTEIIADLPDLTPEDVAESLRYAVETLRERELPLRHTA